MTLGDGEGVQNECSGDEDCSGAVCEADTGMCISQEAEALRIGFSVSPGTEAAPDSASVVTFPSMEVTGPVRRDFVMPRSVLAAGRVKWAATGESVPAQVRFVRPSAFPGGSETELVASTSSSTIELSSGVLADYQMRVTAGESYEVIVEPTGDAARAFPPLHLEDVIAPEQGDVWNLDLVFPAEFGSISGSLSSLQDGAEVPEDGLQVRAIQIPSGRTVSSTAITGTSATLPLTDAEAGSFQLRLSPDAGSFEFRVSAGADRPLFPTLTIDPDLVFSGSVLVPRLESVLYEGVVEAETPSGRVRVSDAVVTLRSDDVFGELTEVTGSFRTTVSTDAQGRFSAEILPGVYDVVVAPSSDPELGVLVQQIRIESGDTDLRGQLFTVPRRAQLGGTVETADGRPLAGASVQASALSRLLQDRPASEFNRSSDALADGSGLFDLRMDVGVYDVVIKPPSGSGFPWLLEPAWIVSEPDRVVSASFDVPAPMPVRGVITGASGPPLTGAEIKAHWVVDEPDGTTRAIPVARDVTDEDGSYELLLAPRL